MTSIIENQVGCAKFSSLTSNKIKTFFVYLALISGISPASIIFPGIEHFPYGIILMFLYGKFNTRSLALTALISIVFLMSVAFYQEFDMAMFKYLIQVFNFISPMFFFRGNEALIARVARNVFWLSIIVGVMQMLHLLVPFEDVMRLLIPRFYGAPIGGYRGVTMLETEPARASFQLLMLYILSVSINRRRGNLMLIILIFTELFMIGSTTGIIISLLYLLFKFIRKPSIKSVALLYFVFLIVIMSMYAPKVNPKIQLIFDLYETKSYEGVFIALAATSGGRVLGTLETIQNIAKWPLGHGIDPDFFAKEKENISEYQVSGYNTMVGGRALSPVLQYAYCFGLLMFLPLWVSMKRCVPIMRFNGTVFFIIIISVIYAPPGSELLLMALMAALSERTSSVHIYSQQQLFCRSTPA